MLLLILRLIIFFILTLLLLPFQLLISILFKKIIYFIPKNYHKLCCKILGINVKKIGRISGYGWSFGYVGGLLMMALCFMLFIQPENPVNLFTGNLLDKESGEHIRIINILIAIWFAIFSLPTFMFVGEKQKNKSIN